jgi:hypothetical protein
MRACGRVPPRIRDRMRAERVFLCVLRGLPSRTLRFNLLLSASRSQERKRTIDALFSRTTNLMDREPNPFFVEPDISRAWTFRPRSTQLRPYSLRRKKKYSPVLGRSLVTPARSPVLATTSRRNWWASRCCSCAAATEFCAAFITCAGTAPALPPKDAVPANCFAADTTGGPRGSTAL